MSFTIPDESNPAYANTEFQSRLLTADLDILAAGIGGVDGVVGNGCLVSESDTPAMSVKVLTGSISSNSTLVSITSGTVVIADANATNPRFDLIVAKDDDTLDVFTGTPDPSPLLPPPAVGYVALAAVYVPVGTGSIIDANIVDKRVAVPDPTVVNAGWTTISAANPYTINNDASMNADPDLKFTMATNTKYRIRGHWVFKAGASWASNYIRLGLGGPASPTLMDASIRVRTQTNPASFYAYPATEYAFAMGLYETTVGLNYAYVPLTTANYSVAVTLDAIVHNGANSGDFAVWWSMYSALAYDLHRLAGSYLEYSVA